MGWNYYMERNRCPHCGRGDRVHIGKSSAGWVFALRRYKNENVLELSDWIRLWLEPGVRILNEDGEEVSVGDMVQIVMDRNGPEKRDEPPAGSDYEIGPRNLWRRVGSTSGSNTWEMHADDDHFTEDGW